MNVSRALEGAARVLSEALGRDLDGEWEWSAMVLRRALERDQLGG